MNMDRALFLDRDGTIIKDCEGVLYKNNIQFEEGLNSFLQVAIQKKIKIIMISNQTSVSKGLISFTEMNEVNNYLLQKINDLLGCNVFDHVFLCPYHPDAQILKYRMNSQDRKPRPGMLFKAKKIFNLDLQRSIMVGDRVSDILAGNIAGCKTVMKISDFSETEMIKTDLKYSEEMIIPNHKVKNLVEIIPIMDNLF